jgi:DNA-binding XRE family transcriptional regulator
MRDARHTDPDAAASRPQVDDAAPAAAERARELRAACPALRRAGDKAAKSGNPVTWETLDGVLERLARLQGNPPDDGHDPAARRQVKAAERQHLIVAGGDVERQTPAVQMTQTPWLADPSTPPIKRLRMMSGLTQREVCQRTGIPVRTYRGLEHGQAPTMRQLVALCALYGVHAEELFPLDADEP